MESPGSTFVTISRCYFDDVGKSIRLRNKKNTGSASVTIAESYFRSCKKENPVAAVGWASEGGVPENLCCPISMELMAQPVISADGFTYDRASIEAWLARGKTTSPTTGAPLEHTHLTPNHLVKSMIAEYQESKG